MCYRPGMSFSGRAPAIGTFESLKGSWDIRDKKMEESDLVHVEMTEGKGTGRCMCLRHSGVASWRSSMWSTFGHQVPHRMGPEALVMTVCTEIAKIHLADIVRRAAHLATSNIMHHVRPFVFYRRFTTWDATVGGRTCLGTLTVDMRYDVLRRSTIRSSRTEANAVEPYVLERV